MTTTILLVFTTISTILLIVAIFVQIIEATRELTKAIKELREINKLREMHKSKSKDNEVKFIGPGVKSPPFGKTPKIKRGRVKGGIH